MPKKSENARHLRRVPVPVKFNIVTMKRAEFVGTDSRGQKVIIARMNRRKPNRLDMELATIQPRNPEKTSILIINQGSNRLEVCYYKNNPYTFFIFINNESFMLDKRTTVSMVYIACRSILEILSDKKRKQK